MDRGILSSSFLEDPQVMLILFLLTQTKYSTKDTHNEDFSKTFIGKCFSHCCLRQWVIVRVNNRLPNKSLEGEKSMRKKLCIGDLKN